MLADKVTLPEIVKFPFRKMLKLLLVKLATLSPIDTPSTVNNLAQLIITESDAKFASTLFILYLLCITYPTLPI
jgi:hypothetical protein